MHVVLDAMIWATVYRDPWPVFRLRYPDWSRERWDSTLSELGLG